ncbi:MAG: hypothetical protein IPO63_17170 [Bacteroidetes bacterium]|nr:hypothetical protein [Bacteroidota bacterium]
MKKLLAKGLLFIASFIVMYLVIFATLFFIQPGGIPFIYRATQGNVWEGGGTHLKFHQFDKTKKWDVVILGSSHAYRGYDPLVFSSHKLETYNLGSSNQHMMCSYQIIKTHISKDNCKLLVLDLFDKVFANNDIESKSDVIQNVDDDKTALAIAISSNDIRALNMITLRYFNKTLNPLNTDTNNYRNGYLKVHKHLDPKKKDITKLNWKYKGERSQKRYLNLLLEYCRKEGINIVAVSHPVPELYPMRDHDKFLADVNPLLKKYKVPYYDYTNYKDMGKIIFYSDPTHLNQIGTIKFNKMLINDLKRDRILSN